MSKKFLFTKTKFDVAADESVPAESEGVSKIATIKGYAITWNTLSSDRGGYKVRLMPGSARFTEPAHALYHHEWTGGPLGDTDTNTLRILPADDYGIPVEIDLPNTTNGRDTLELVKSGRMKGMSFSMVDEPSGDEVEENGELIFNVTDFLCDEVTCTAIPAFDSTTLGAKFQKTTNQKGNAMAKKLADEDVNDETEEVKDEEKVEASDESESTEEGTAEITEAKEVLQDLLEEVEAEIEKIEEVEAEAEAMAEDGEGEDTEEDEPAAEASDDDVDSEDTEELDEDVEDEDAEELAEGDEDTEDEEEPVQASRAKRHSRDRVEHAITLERLRLASFNCK